MPMRLWQVLHPRVVRGSRSSVLHWITLPDFVPFLMGWCWSFVMVSVHLCTVFCLFCWKFEFVCWSFTALRLDGCTPEICVLLTPGRNSAGTIWAAVQKPLGFVVKIFKTFVAKILKTFCFLSALLYIHLQTFSVDLSAGWRIIGRWYLVCEALPPREMSSFWVENHSQLWDQLHFCSFTVEKVDAERTREGDLAAASSRSVEKPNRVTNVWIKTAYGHPALSNTGFFFVW